MLTKNDLRIMEFLIKNQEKKFSIREISRQVKIDYKLVHNSIQRLEEKKLIDYLEFGKTGLWEINLRNNIDDLVQVENIKAKKLLEKEIGIRVIIKDLKEKMNNPYYTLIIFGSYAKSKQHQQSDLDLIIIVPNHESIKEAEIAINSVAKIIPLKLHGFTFTMDDFKRMLIANEELNVAKETLNNHIILHGAEAYYKLLEGI
ncbi:nucleotidyltransferase domain-containing protein [Candidatus Woesearchaeota archaeon]|nr:nucleotidyltransferase domain-containing protein [Candidatus Woesearchaeota archaeon]